MGENAHSILKTFFPFTLLSIVSVSTLPFLSFTLFSVHLLVTEDNTVHCIYIINCGNGGIRHVLFVQERSSMPVVYSNYVISNVTQTYGTCLSCVTSRK